jgi:omega-6 fatty acid desaturase (delta-12 desaturase)
LAIIEQAPRAAAPLEHVPSWLERHMHQRQVDVAALKEEARRLAAHCNAYRGAIPHVAVRELLVTLVPFLATVTAMFLAAEQAYWLTLLLALPAAGLLVRLFIIQHDCGHGSFFKTRGANDALGRVISVLTLSPYGLWRREHAQHHAGSGNLERRGVGDIDTLTVREYRALPLREKLRYRLYRNPLFLFGFGVPFYFLVIQRLPWLHAYPARETWKSVLGLNIAMALVYGPLVYLLGWWTVGSVMLPVLHLASAIGGWLFFIQHQFEETHWEHEEDWQFQIAALHGSSYYVLPAVLNWFSGNIGMHHIHHLNSMIPFYRLPDCLHASPELQNMNRLTLRESLACVRCKLWDEDQRRMVTFAEAVQAPAH